MAAVPAAALKRAAAESALVIGVESDILFTINEQNAIADAFEAAGTATEFVPLASLEGHDAFLVDIEPFAAAIGRFLAEDDLFDGPRVCRNQAQDRITLPQVPRVSI